MKSFQVVLLAVLFLAGAAFTGCDIFDSGGSSTNSGTPFTYTDIELNTAYNETIESWGTKVYRVRTTTAGIYTISLTNLASDLGWSLWNRSSCIDDQNGDQYIDAASEVYAETLEADSYYYVVVDEYGRIESSYTLQVIH